MRIIDTEITNFHVTKLDMKWNMKWYFFKKIGWDNNKICAFSRLSKHTVRFLNPMRFWFLTKPWFQKNTQNKIMYWISDSQISSQVELKASLHMYTGNSIAPNDLCSHLPRDVGKKTYFLESQQFATSFLSFFPCYCKKTHLRIQLIKPLLLLFLFLLPT